MLIDQQICSSAKATFSPQQGNVLFLILIAVVLFAALSYAVSQSTRGSGSSKSETMSLAIAQAMQQASAIKMGIDRIRVMEGATENQITFSGPHFTGPSAISHTNSFCASTACWVFDTAGGKTIYTNPPPDIAAGCLNGKCTAGSTLYNRWFFTGNAFIPGIGSDNIADLLMVALVDQATCVAINTVLGVTNPSGAPPQRTGSDLIFQGGFNGNFASYNVTKVLPAEVTGKTAACVNQQHATYSSDFAWFYIVLLER